MTDNDTAQALEVVRANRLARQSFRESIKNGGLKPIVKDSSIEEKIIFDIVEKLSKNEIAQKFLRKKPKAFVLHNDPTLFGKLLDSMAFEAQGRYVIGKDLPGLLSEPELFVMMAHEFGHTLRLDTHIKRDAIPYLKEPRANLASYISVLDLINEQIADKFAIYATQDAESLKSALKKIVSKTLELITQDNPQRDLTDIKSIADKDLQMRFELIDKINERMTKPGGREQIEQELRFEYLAQHKKFFPGQFSRSIANTRAIAGIAGREQ